MGRLAFAIATMLVLVPRAWAEQKLTWKDEWEIERGFAIEIDSAGYELPVGMAFVPEPGPDAGDPLYYVVELRGRVKVVTNDRTVHTFAEGVGNYLPTEELPDPAGEGGSAGICLDGEHGYVFVTHVYVDPDGNRRNGITRFSTTPATFGLKPWSSVHWTEMFMRDWSSLSHQIGPCQVDGGRLYVSVGDGMQPKTSRSLQSTNGKILRMRLDEEPAPDNPFYRDDSGTNPVNYVFALGLRNPFGLKVVDGRVLVSDNGPDVDRFLEVQAGEDYLYDGSDWSIGSRADLVFSPAVSPVGFDRYRRELGYFPDAWTDHVFLALSGSPWEDPPGRGLNGRKSVVAFQWDVKEGRVVSKPRPFIRYRGNGVQLPLDVSFGAEAMYVVPLMPDARGLSAILRVTYDPVHPHPHSLDDLEAYLADPFLLLDHRGCLSCHSLSDDDPWTKVGPPLDRRTLRARLEARLTSHEYREASLGIDALGGEFWKKYGGWRHEVLDAKGNERVMLWLKYHLLEPRFDNPDSQMPNLGLSEKEAEVIADFLAPAVQRGDRVRQMMNELLGMPRHRHAIGGVVLGSALGVLGGWLLASITRRWRSRAT